MKAAAIAAAAALSGCAWQQLIYDSTLGLRLDQCQHLREPELDACLKAAHEHRHELERKHKESREAGTPGRCQNASCPASLRTSSSTR